MAAAISAAWVSNAKWPVSKKRTTAPGMSRAVGPPAGIAKPKHGHFAVSGCPGAT
ncbi:MAG: hypothetical protein P4L55_11220 [Syntrophobacteraceae bacterium]|nr:hypothetical protein [Syntrophobacteraceae bacterium]